MEKREKRLHMIWNERKAAEKNGNGKLHHLGYLKCRATSLIPNPLWEKDVNLSTLSKSHRLVAVLTAFLLFISPDGLRAQILTDCDHNTKDNWVRVFGYAEGELGLGRV